MFCIVTFVEPHSVPEFNELSGCRLINFLTSRKRKIE